MRAYMVKKSLYGAMKSLRFYPGLDTQANRAAMESNPQANPCYPVLRCYSSPPLTFSIGDVRLPGWSRERFLLHAFDVHRREARRQRGMAPENRRLLPVSLRDRQRFRALRDCDY